MGQAGWRDRVGRPSLVMGTGLLLAMIFPAAIWAGPTPRLGAPAACVGLDVAAAARAGLIGAQPDNLSVETLVAADGVYSGRVLAVVPRTGRGPVAVTLPAESFVSPARGDVVVFGAHNGETGSEIFAIDAASGCRALLARVPQVVRSAVIDPDGSALYVHSVSAGDRRDLGVTRHDLTTGRQAVVVEPLPESAEFGRTFATELRWSVEGDALAVQSCGAAACRTRVLDVATGHVTTHDDPAHGSLIGLTASTLYAMGPCHWAPCSLLAVDRATGDAAVLADEAVSASLASDDSGARLTINTSAGTLEVAP